MKRILTMMAACLAMAAGAAAQNPIFLNKAYNSDPQARVWTIDGKPALFVYGSKDENPSYYCSGKYDVFSTEDMIHWKGGESFSSRDIPYNDEVLYAPDCIEKDGIITEAEHHFHEGIQAFKHNGTYYLTFADISRRGMPTCIGYATSDCVTGPYKYRGVIIDNFGCDPAVWNNHGSVVCFKDQWYVFYHRSSWGSNTMRKSCVEPIEILPDGTIDVFSEYMYGGTVASFKIPEGDGKTFITLEAKVNSNLSGIKPIRMRFHGDADKNLFTINSFRFE